MDIYSPALDLRPLDTSRLQARDHAHVASFAEGLPRVLKADPGGSVAIGDLTRAMTRALPRGRGVPAACVRRLVKAVGLTTLRYPDEHFVQGVSLR